MEELLEKYLNYTFDLSSFKINIKNSHSVELIDQNNDKILINQMFDYIFVIIDNEVFNIYKQKKTIDNQEHFVIVNKNMLKSLV